MSDDNSERGSDLQPSAASDDLWVGINDLGHTEFYHVPCGKVWCENQGDDAPNHCPNCGKNLP